MGAAFDQRLLHVADPLGRAGAAVVARPGHVAEPERLDLAAWLDVPALPALAALDRRDERVHDAIDLQQWNADARQRLACLRADDVGVGEARADRVDVDSLRRVRR